MLESVLVGPESCEVLTVVIPFLRLNANSKHHLHHAGVDLIIWGAGPAVGFTYDWLQKPFMRVPLGSFPSICQCLANDFAATAPYSYRHWLSFLFLASVFNKKCQIYALERSWSKVKMRNSVTTYIFSLFNCIFCPCVLIVCFEVLFPISVHLATAQWLISHTLIPQNF